jgi:DNA-binding NarL/FixJ family response regulator
MIESSRHEEEMPTTTKMLLANGHRLFRRGLEVMLSSAGEDIEVLGEAQDAEEPPAQERKIIERLLKASPASALVVVAPQDGFPYSFRHLLGQRVSAYMDRDASPEDLVVAIQAAVRGSRGTRNAPFMAVSRAALRRAEQQDGKCEFSGRELEVLLLASRGLSNRQSAHYLRLSEATVKRHLANLYPKIGVSSCGERPAKLLGRAGSACRT